MALDERREPLRQRLPGGPQPSRAAVTTLEELPCSGVSPSGESQRSQAPNTSGEVSGWNCTPHAAGPKRSAWARPSGRVASSTAPAGASWTTSSL